MKKILLFCIGSLLICSQSQCEDISLISSDDTRYVRDQVICTGNVVIVYSNRVITADKILFNKTNNSVTAEGNVIIKDEKQNSYFMDYIYIAQDFSHGLAKNIKIISNDNSRLAAEECSIQNGLFILKHTIYTPCYQCTDNGNLTWQIKAESVQFDPDEYTIYRNTNFELFGTPILQLPYISTVSPTVKRKSGFLVPKFSTASGSGLSILPQYLISISESQELILKPIITTKIGGVAWGYYGIRFPNGEFNIDASITGTSSVNTPNKYAIENRAAVKKINASGYRGHIFAKGKYYIDDIWRGSIDINLASDDFYLKRFPFLPDVDRILESNCKIEGFEGDNYTLVKAAMFQGQTSHFAPKVLPVIEKNYRVGLCKGTLGIDATIVNLDFHHGKAVTKAVVTPSWNKSILLPNGQILDITGLLSLRALKRSDAGINRTSHESSSVLIPQVKCAWQWPLLMSHDQFQTVITPIFGVILASNKRCPDIFEDQFHEINDINLFDGNRSISLYNVDPGSRIFYGLKISGYEFNQQYRLTIGQSRELSSLSNKLEVSGLKYKSSNIVSSLELLLNEYVSFVYYGSYFSHKKDWSKLEAGLRFVYNDFSANILSFKGCQCFYDPFNPELFRLSEIEKTQTYKGIMLDCNWAASQTWNIRAGVTFGNKSSNDMAANKNSNINKLVKYSAGFEYKNECTTVEFSVERKNYKSGDLKPDTSLKIVVHLKNLGM